jgi:hypothetical protein
MYFPGIIYMFHYYPAQVPQRYLITISIISLACASLGITAAALDSSAMKKGVRVVAYTVMSMCSLVPISQVWVEQVHDPVFRLTVLRYVGCVAVAGMEP